MELLTCALLCALFTSARPAGLWLHQDADLPDSDLTSDLDPDWPDQRMRSRYTALRSSSESQSSESSESSVSSVSSESSESSEELALTQAPPTDTPLASSAIPTGIPVAMTTAGMVTPGTVLPTVDNSTVPEPCPTGGCVTVDIPTGTPVTASRGDN